MVRDELVCHLCLSRIICGAECDVMNRTPRLGLCEGSLDLPFPNQSAALVGRPLERVYLVGLLAACPGEIAHS
jgi:hypothetical protein